MSANTPPSPGGVGLRAVLAHNATAQPHTAFLAELRAAIPQFFTAGGEFNRERFDAALAEANTREAHDGYRLGFVGKDYARLQSGLRTETVLVPDAAHNNAAQNRDSRNVFITGDNLDALKHLENAYTGCVDVIYIDPPYNTGGDDFVYHDNIHFTDADLADKLQLSEKEIARLRALEGKSSHSAWLTFMYPRLAIAKRLLKDTGVIFISIDDNEQANLKLLCDEMFGETNFVGNIAWESKTKSQNTKTAYNKLQPKIEHIFVYTKKEHFRFNLIEKSKKEYPLFDEQGEYREHILEVMNATGIRGRETMVFEIEGISPPLGKQWKLGQAQISTYQNSGNLFIRNGKIIIKMRPDEERAEITEPFWAFLSKEIGTAESAKTALTELFGIDNIFDTVKPTEIIKRLLFHAIDKSALILDFFAGSGTTADAVMQLNAEDGGSRSYILVQLDEPVKAGSEAEKAGYKTIDEISRARITKAAEKIASERKPAAPDLFPASPTAAADLGFQHFRLNPLPETTWDKIQTFDPGQDLLDDSAMLAALGGAEMLLATWMLADGYTFNATRRVENLAGYPARLVSENDAATLYLIEPGWGTGALTALLNRLGKSELAVAKVVYFPCSFAFELRRELQTAFRTALDREILLEERI